MNDVQETPRLVAVDDESAARAGSPAGGEPARSTSGLVWALAIALAACVILLAAQLQRAGALQEQVASLRFDLEAAHANLARYETHMGEVRDHVSELSGRMAALEALVAVDPVASAGADGPPAAQEPSPGP